ncbi:ABC transporter substrate-binding protein [Pseudoflavonifractor phocaeensis]|uniref:ABC transporter substrate-binding protein n=1 Tax=Pseudoflavonifractor phocaeensis TaxID=1870988 RepID=UPI001F3FCAF3|nr:ABC transporter substrate-binding protein [Pseudoflavonifractor phocaeensis]MCF2661925.1 ABC transporter substrate-binding protein [Pseudoflavonifractor phocaeensis]
MKKLISVMASALVIAGILAGCGSSSSNSAPSGAASSGSAASAQETYKVAIVQPMSHTSLDQIRDTIVSKLEASGKSIEITTENANGDSTALSTILSNCKAEGVDLVVPIATSTAQSAKTVFDGDSTPIVFAAVSDPTAAGLTGDDCQYITGVSNNIPAAEIVKLIFNFQPDCQKIGFLYTSSEANSVSTINAAKTYCDQEGIAYEEVSIANLSELQTAAETLISRGVDALYTGNDNSIASAMATYTDVAYADGIPVYCGADSMVADGGFATIGVNYVQLGEQVADLVLKVMDGAAPADLPYETLSDYAKFVNLQAAGRFGADFPDSAYEGYEVLVEEDGTSHFGA